VPRGHYLAFSKLNNEIMVCLTNVKRQILYDGVLMNELVNLEKMMKYNFVIFKVYFERAIGIIFEYMIRVFC
jgi:hypothetical protein